MEPMVMVVVGATIVATSGMLWYLFKDLGVEVSQPPVPVQEPLKTPEPDTVVVVEDKPAKEKKKTVLELNRMTKGQLINHAKSYGRVLPAHKLKKDMVKAIMDDQK